MDIIVLIAVFLAVVWAPARVFAIFLVFVALLWFCPLAVVFGIIGAIIIKRGFDEV